MNDSGNTILPEAVVHAQMGKGNWIGVRCVIYNNVKIGDTNHISDLVYIPPGVTIKNHCFIGPRTTFANDKYPPSKGKYWRDTVVEDRAVIGAACTILPGVVIGKNAMVGAGSVVTKNVLAGTVVFGNPARKPGEGAQ